MVAKNSIYCVEPYFVSLFYMDIVLSVFLHLDNLIRTMELYQQGLILRKVTKNEVINNIGFSYMQSSVGPLATF